MVGCQDKAAMAELEEFKVQAEVEAQNKELAKELFADDFSLKVPGFDEPWGTDILFQAIKSHYAAFPDWTHVIENVVAEGEKVAVKLNQNGTHEAEYEGIPATGVEATLPAMHLFTVKNGKVVDWFAVEDYLGLYMQLGMELKPKEEK
jgi:predicted ester cyclase